MGGGTPLLSGLGFKGWGGGGFESKLMLPGMPWPEPVLSGLVFRVQGLGLGL